jgi:mRNA interferase MazF
LPRQGEVWGVDLDPVRGHEQGGERPALILSVTKFNEGPAGLVILAPITSVGKGIPLHVPIDPPEGGVKRRSYIKPEDIRSVSVDRLAVRWGAVRHMTLFATVQRVQLLLHAPAP